MDIKNNKYYKLWFKDPMTYVMGAVLLSVFQIITFAVTGNPWGVTGPFANWGAWVFELFGGNVDSWSYFSTKSAQATLKAGFLNDPGSIRNLGVIVGALFSTLMASQFKFKKIKSKKQVIAAVLGGF